mgnify:CR=1 FL=1
MSTTRVDLAIIGAGIAGLSLAVRLKQNHPNLALAVIGPIDDRPQRISTWLNSTLTEPDWIRPCIEGRWSSWQFRDTSGHYQTQHADVWRYATLNAQRFKQEREALADRLGSVRITESCNRVSTTANRYQVLCDSNTVQCNHVVDTRPPKVPEHTIKQQFVGYTLRCDRPHNRHSPLLMDFSASAIAHDGLTFIYCLPLSERDLLVEATTFSPTRYLQSDYDRGIQEWITANLPPDITWQRLETESGLLPMGPVLPVNPRLVRCGIAGGASRASTGYAWHGTQRQIEAISEIFSRTAKLSNSRAFSLKARLMDNVFLRVLRHQPDAVYRLFMAMARSLPGDTFAQFLCDEGGWTPCLKTIQVAPKWPFVQSLWRS